jgi:uncharacterized protein (DUF2147 family)
MTYFLRAVLVCSLVSPVALAAPAAAVTSGVWQSPEGAILRVGPCGDAVCLTVVRLPPDAPERVDKNNPDAALRGRALCGLSIGTGFHQDDALHLSGGRLYDPKTGHTYRGKIVADGDSLHLRGYLGISALGRTETWKRVAAVDGCHA